MSGRSIEDLLVRYVREEILDESDGASLDVDDDLLATDLVDSIGMMRVVAFLEETFDVQIPPEDVTIERFRTIRAIAGYVSGRVAHNA